MQTAMILAALCSSVPGISAFQVPAPRTRFGCRGGCCLEARATEGIRSTMAGRSLLYGVGVGSSGDDETQVSLEFFMDIVV